jgi:hypothetical protein
MKEYIFREKKSKVLKDYDRALLGFRFADALDLVMAGVCPFDLAFNIRATPFSFSQF